MCGYFSAVRMRWLMDLLVRGCSQMGLTLSETQIEQFRLYFDLLAKWNQKINLTAIDDEALSLIHI